MHYISGGNGIFAIFEQEGSNSTMYYIHKDYLGSYYCVTSDNGIVIEYNSVEQIYSFDPWGRRHNHTNWSYDNVPTTFLFDRGFTCHEHLDLFALINMNGRVYDPMLGRFLSPDPIVQGLNNSQNFNRYSYALNNPLKFIDPTGYTHGPPRDFKLGRGDFAPQGYGFHIGHKGMITYGGNVDAFSINSTSAFNNEGGANNSCETQTVYEVGVTNPKTGEKFTVLIIVVESTTSENVEEEGGGNPDDPPDVDISSGEGKYFEGVRVYTLNFGHFKDGAAMTVPGVGIFVGPGGAKDIDLLRHEFGHILQYNKWGAKIFWGEIVPASLKSANKANSNWSFDHMNTWTEWSANYLSYNYLNQPSDWNTRDYRIYPNTTRPGVMPPFVIGPFDFKFNWLDN